MTARYPFGPGFVAGSETSEDAATSIAPGRAKMLAAVYRVVASSEPEGVTCDAVEAITGGRHQSISARIRELVLAGRVYDSGVRRATRSGRRAVVYRVRTAEQLALDLGSGDGW